MSERRWRTSLVIAVLLLVAVALTGCPKKPETGLGGAAATAGGTGVGGGTSETGGAAGAGGSAGVGGAGAGTAGQGGNVSVGGTTVPPGPTPSEFAEAAALKDIHFAFDRSEILAAEADILNANAAWLTTNGRALVMIEGHCDERGTNEYNLALGQRRASATRDYLVSKGIEARRISLISYGKERPLCNEQAESCWARNRRAHFLIKR